MKDGKIKLNSFIATRLNESFYAYDFHIDTNIRFVETLAVCSNFLAHTNVMFSNKFDFRPISKNEIKRLNKLYDTQSLFIIHKFINHHQHEASSTKVESFLPD